MKDTEKKTIQGWIGKQQFKDLSDLSFCTTDDEIELSRAQIYPTKGQKNWWPESQWPPLKISITITAVRG